VTDYDDAHDLGADVLDDLDPALRAKIEEAQQAERQRAEKMRAAVGSDDEAFTTAIMQLAALPPADYQRSRRDSAKKLGITCGFLDAVIRAVRMAGGEEQTKTHQREQLIALAMKHGEFWRDDAETGFCSVSYEQGRVEHHAVKSTGFKRWLIHAYGDAHTIKTEHGPRPAAPGTQALTEALAAIDALAGRGPLDRPAIRIGEARKLNTQGAELERDRQEASLASCSVMAAVYLDLGDASHRAIEIDQGGWRVVAAAPVRFLRCPGMMALPIPVRGESALEALKKLIGQKGDIWILLLGWLFGCFAPRGPYPVLAITGEQGSGKTTLARVLRRLIDPNKVDLGTKPKDERDLAIAARNSWVLGFDNMSSIDPDLSDAMCRLATGGGFRTRQLFTDDGEVLFSASRPQLLNAIPDVARAPDLLDRAILLELHARPDTEREFEADFWRKFEALASAVLAALLDAVTGALKRLPTTVLKSKPRMADFARWVEAGAPDLGLKPGQFLKAYERNRRNAARMALDGDVLVPVLRTFLEGNSNAFTGTATELLSRLNAKVDLDTKRTKGWPGAPHALTGRLKRLAPALRRDGIIVETGRDMHARGLSLKLEIPKEPDEPLEVDGDEPADDAHDANDAPSQSLSDPSLHVFEGEL
jgi:energy-coupling factor transporter ATP-binding protein EcfA2